MNLNEIRVVAFSRFLASLEMMYVIRLFLDGIKRRENVMTDTPLPVIDLDWIITCNG